MANYRLSIIPAGSGIGIRIESKDTTMDFLGLRLGADNLSIGQTGSGASAKLSTTARLSVGTAVDSSDATNYGQVTTLLQTATASDTWQQAVVAELSTSPGSPATGSRYLVGLSPTGVWAGQPSTIAVWSGSAWSFQSPSEGWIVKVTTQTNRLRLYTSSAWVSLYFSGAFVDKRFVVGVGGQTTFACSSEITLTSTNKIDVSRNGQGLEENYDYTRNVGTNSVVFSYTVPQGARVLIRSFLE